MGERLCALPLEHVLEVMRPLAVERVEGAPPFVSGLSVVRGEAVAVVDARRLLGEDPAPAQRWVSLHVGPRRLALAVTAVLGTRSLARAELSSAPPWLGEAAELRATLGTLDGHLLEVLESARLLPQLPGDSDGAASAGAAP